jgi:beta-phosphoglucomutase-like phosphatase (HAD superfamily)
MRFDGMIFDIEGTLIDCIPQNLRSWQETLSSFGMTVPLEVLQLYSGMDGDDMLQILAPDMDKKLRKRALEAEGKNFQARYLQSVRAFAGIRLLFEAIKRGGGKIAIKAAGRGESCKRRQADAFQGTSGVHRAARHGDVLPQLSCLE